MHTSLEVPALPVMTRRDLNLRWLLARVAVIVVLLDVALFAALGGLRLRKAAFLDTADFHFKGDVRNGFKWGMAAEDEGVLNLYDRIKSELDAGVPRRTLDYSPLRLTAVWLWARWANRHYPGVTQWLDDYDFTRPMLNANTIAEAASAVLVFALIWLWTQRMDDARRPVGEPRKFFRGVIPGMFGALLFWFNPAVIWVSHCWPQWDVWLMPFFLAAVLLASLDWWFAAGLSLAIGANLKGQILLGAPVLLLWPIISLRFGAALRLACGLGLAAVLIALPWMKLDHEAIVWCTRMSIVILALLPMALWRGNAVRARLSSLVARFFAIGRTGGLARNPLVMSLVGAMLAVAILVLQWRLKFPAHLKLMPLAVAAPIAAAGFSRFLPKRLVAYVFVGALTAIIFMTIPYFGADDAWYTIGFKYGTEKYGNMIAGNGVWNIAKMQQTYAFGGTSFDKPDDPLTLPVVHQVVTYRTASVIVYGGCLLICAIGAALHSRRRRADTRFLVAIVAPWVCFFVVLTQMHGRYLMWGAGLCALLAGVSVGMALLGVLVTVISTLGTLENQLIFTPSYAPDWLRDLQAVDPHVGWMLLLIAGVMLYVSVYPERSTYSCGVEGYSLERR